MKGHEQAVENLYKIVHDLKLALGVDLQARTYSEALNYPFRANALKSIIVAVSKPCEKGTFLPVSDNFEILITNLICFFSILHSYKNWEHICTETI